MCLFSFFRFFCLAFVMIFHPTLETKICWLRNRSHACLAVVVCRHFVARKTKNSFGKNVKNEAKNSELYGEGVARFASVETCRTSTTQQWAVSTNVNSQHRSSTKVFILDALRNRCVFPRRIRPSEATQKMRIKNRSQMTSTTDGKWKMQCATNCELDAIWLECGVGKRQMPSTISPKARWERNWLKSACSSCHWLLSLTPQIRRTSFTESCQALHFDEVFGGNMLHSK